MHTYIHTHTHTYIHTVTVRITPTHYTVRMSQPKSMSLAHTILCSEGTDIHVQVYREIYQNSIITDSSVSLETLVLIFFYIWC
jgi:hypothetical protein